MNVRVKFLGGAGSVTGSKYLLEVDDYRLLIDCGLFQGLKELRLRNWDPFAVDPSSIHAVILTHAHIDHSGYLPRLCKEGFSGPVYCTEATADLVQIMLRDAGKLQEEEALFAKKKGYSRHENPQPLFTVEEAERSLQQVAGVRFGEALQVSPTISVRFTHAGHILGAAVVEVTVVGQYQTKKIVFSGDLGPYDNPLHVAPASIQQADILFIESTYGHKDTLNEALYEELHQLLNRCEDRGGVLVVPAFSVGRTQLMLYYFWQLRRKKLMPDWPVYVDSPMAISVTNLYKKHHLLHKLRDSDLEDGHYIFDDPHVRYVQDQASSTLLNARKRDAIILSASGMATGGRILHHLYHRLRRPQDTILFSGYQAEGSRGRRIVEGEKDIKIFGESVPVLAHIETMEGFSAHAGKSDLEQWTKFLDEKPPKLTFIVHGESTGAQALSNSLTARGWNTMIPEYLESVQLFEGI